VLLTTLWRGWRQGHPIQYPSQYPSASQEVTEEDAARGAPLVPVSPVFPTPPTAGALVAAASPLTGSAVGIGASTNGSTNR